MAHHSPLQCPLRLGTFLLASLGKSLTILARSATPDLDSAVIVPRCKPSQKNLKSALSTVLQLLHTSALSSSLYASPLCTNIVAYSPLSCTLPLFYSPHAANLLIIPKLQLPTFTPLHSPIPHAAQPPTTSSKPLLRTVLSLPLKAERHAHIIYWLHPPAYSSRPSRGSTASLSNCRGETEVSLWQRSGKPVTRSRPSFKPTARFPLSQNIILL